MQAVNEIFTKNLKKHKVLIANMIKTEDKGMIVPVQKTGKELALAYAQCKCEKCGSTENLQYHHLIQRPTKFFTDFWKYISQRNYWADILILCYDHHREIENKREITHEISEKFVISQSVIDKVKKKYGI